MRFKRHLFISYTHKDNKPLFRGDDGWVSRFHETLSVVLETRLGRPPEIWRDQRLQGNDIFTPEIMQQLPESALLLAVLSQGYVESQWCRDEAHAFCEAAAANGGLSLGNKARVFTVVKSPPDSLDALDALPPAFRAGMDGYKFYEPNEKDAPVEFDPIEDKDSRAKYRDMILTLGFNIARLIKDIERQDAAEAAALVPAANDAVGPTPTAPVPASAAAPPKVSIYLAECASDRNADRAALCTELRMRGYSVLPDQELPRKEAPYRLAVRAALAGCALSVHLVGARQGWVPESDGDDGLSAVEIQNQEAVARVTPGADGGLQRVVSLPAGTASTDPRQQRFITALHEDPDAQRGADLIIADLECVKSAVQAALARIESPKPAPAPAATNGRMVYLVCDPRDRSELAPLGRLLTARGCTVRVPAFADDAGAARQAHEQRLAQCDAVLVFHGAGSGTWFDSIQTDIAKARALRDGRAIPTAWTWLAGPSSFDKTSHLDFGEPGFINAMEGFAEALAEPFLAALVAAQSETLSKNG